VSSDDAMCKLRLRNASQLLQLQAADVVIAPTHWQASTFPKAYQDRIHVIHDGIDTQALAPGTHTRVQLPNGQQVQTGDEVVTFVSRNLEPYRGYHSFMRALPALLRKRPNAQVLIIGGDSVGYGQAAPAGQTWKHIFANEMLPQLTATQRARVHFLGKLPYASYLAVMRVCAVHVYLTYPFVLSWSLLEAMSLGCAIVGSDTPPVREVISHGNTGHLVDFFDPAALAHAIAQLLADPSARQQLGQSAHALVRQRYDLNSVCMPQHMQWMERLLQTRVPASPALR
jgi:glycosyltransferase involved in cell wall biosynthesis